MVDADSQSWDAIQHEQFIDWVNKRLALRNMRVDNLSGDFANGVALINLLEIVFHLHLGRYNKDAKFLVQKIDNVNIAIKFCEITLGKKLIGCSVQEIVKGNQKHIMALLFMLTQKAPATISATPAPVAHVAEPEAVPLGAGPKRKSFTRRDSVGIAHLKLSLQLDSRSSETEQKTRATLQSDVAQTCNPSSFQKIRNIHVAAGTVTQSPSTSPPSTPPLSPAKAETAPAKPPPLQREMAALLSPLSATTAVQLRTSDQKVEEGTRQKQEPAKVEKAELEQGHSTPEEPNQQLEEQKRLKNQKQTLQSEEDATQAQKAEVKEAEVVEKEKGKEDTTAEEGDEEEAKTEIRSELAVSERECDKEVRRRRHAEKKRHQLLLEQQREAAEKQQAQEFSKTHKKEVHPEEGTPMKSLQHDHETVTTKDSTGSAETKGLFPTVSVTPPRRHHRRSSEPPPSDGEVASPPKENEKEVVAPKVLMPAVLAAEDMREERRHRHKHRHPSPLGVSDSSDVSDEGCQSSPEPVSTTLSSAVVELQAICNCNEAVQKLAELKELTERCNLALKFFAQETHLKAIVALQAAVRGKRERVYLESLRCDVRSAKRRRLVATELVTSEREYVEGLGVLVKVFFVPLKAIVNDQDHKRIFSDVQVILNFSTVLMNKLAERMKNWNATQQKMGDVFLHMMSFFKIYTSYIKNYELSFNTVNECKQKYKDFAPFLEKARAQPECKGMDFYSFLILPVQRLPRYSLLLTELLKNTPEQHADYKDLVRANHEIKGIAEFVNAKKREAENLNQVIAIQNILTGMPQGITAPHRRFVKQGVLTELEGHNLITGHHAFLFNDILVLGKKSEPTLLPVSRNRRRRTNSSPHSRSSSFDPVISSGSGNSDESSAPAAGEKVRYEATIMLRSCSLDNRREAGSPSPARGSPPQSTTFVLKTSEKCYVFSCGTEEQKLAWMSDVDECIAKLLTVDRSRSSSPLKSPSNARLADSTIVGSALRLAAALSGDVVSRSNTPVTPPDGSPDLEGEFLVLSGGQKWRRRLLALYPTCLISSPADQGASESGVVKRVPLLDMCVQVARMPDEHYVFQLSTPSHLFFVAAPDATVLFAWINQIRTNIQALLTEEKAAQDAGVFTEVKSPSGLLQELIDSSSETLAALMKVPGNLACADCSHASVSCVSLNHGVVLCSECAVVHKSLPPGTSLIVPLTTLAVCSPAVVKPLCQGGNAFFNSKREAELVDVTKPTPTDSAVVKMQWIRAKYVKPVRFESDADGVLKEGVLAFRNDPDSTNWKTVSVILCSDNLRYMKHGKEKRASGEKYVDPSAAPPSHSNEARITRRNSIGTVGESKKKLVKIIDTALCTPRFPDFVSEAAPFGFEVVTPVKILCFSGANAEVTASWLQAIYYAKKKLPRN
eukprot:TRINITY_DN4474_c0_g1_i1.p1 TRINITY_DN4474_c0_g1~~TRINITY_DN4474_c0_g1_i1.p1  ORF type:complete len:1406 (-),score=376.29 TRINITY_DN4474_c0_g1_i1:102-4319(-)